MNGIVGSVPVAAGLGRSHIECIEKKYGSLAHLSRLCSIAMDASRKHAELGQILPRSCRHRWSTNRCVRQWKWYRCNDINSDAKRL